MSRCSNSGRRIRKPKQIGEDYVTDHDERSPSSAKKHRNLHRVKAHISATTPVKPSPLRQTGGSGAKHSPANERPIDKTKHKTAPKAPIQSKLTKVNGLGATSTTTAPTDAPKRETSAVSHVTELIDLLSI